MCMRNLVKVNGRYSKPSMIVHTGDSIEIEMPHGVRRITILKIPEGNISRKDVNLYYDES